MDERFMLRVTQEEYARVMGMRKEWQRDVRSGRMAGENIFARFCREMGRAAGNKYYVAWLFLREMSGQKEKMERERKAVLRELKRVLGRNFEWHGEAKSWVTAWSYVRGHEDEREAVMRVVSGVVMLERIDLWLGWHNGHSYDGGKEL